MPEGRAAPAPYVVVVGGGGRAAPVGIGTVAVGDGNAAAPVDNPVLVPVSDATVASPVVIGVTAEVASVDETTLDDIVVIRDPPGLGLGGIAAFFSIVITAG